MLDRTGEVWSFDGDILLVVGPPATDPGPYEINRHPVVWLHVTSNITVIHDGATSWTYESPYCLWEEEPENRRLF